MPFSIIEHRKLVNGIKLAVASLTRAKGLNNTVENEMTAAIISAAFYGNYTDTDPTGAEPTYYDAASPEEMLQIVKEMTEFVSGENSLSFSNSEENTITTRIQNIVSNGNP